MQRLDFRECFFEDIVIQKLGYNPRIEIKPAHLANGFFRAICGGYTDNKAQHLALYPKKYPNISPDFLSSDPKLQSEFRKFSYGQQEALRFLSGAEDKRAMLNALLGADKTLYQLVKTSSYSLSHADHITSDNHDRSTGKWLYSIIKKGKEHLALDLLSELLIQEPLDRSDELSIITLPLAGSILPYQQNQEDYLEPEDIRKYSNGKFDDPIIQAIRSAFDMLAYNDMDSARNNGKLDTLRHFVTLGCFSVYFHIANAGKKGPLVPLIFRFDKSLTTITQASMRSYQFLLRSIDDFMYSEILAVLDQLNRSGLYGRWDEDVSIEKHINETINWYRTTTEKSQNKERKKVTNLQQDCFNFYQSYRSKTASISPMEALAHALTDILSAVLSSTPQDVVRGLGTRIGLLSHSRERKRKTYDPHPDFLEVLVRATVPKNEVWTLHELTQKWADSFGIYCGVIGDEITQIKSPGGYIDQGEWIANMNSLAEILEMSGYARRYADGVVLVSVQQ